MNDRIEIRLTEINEKPVELNAMNADALQSFMLVVGSLKAIAESVVPKEELVFSIQEGSALCCVEGEAGKVASIYHEIDSAIKGESFNKEVSDGLRTIQQQFKRENVAYAFQYHQASAIIDMHERLATAKRIGLKRRKAEFKLKLAANAGTIKQIGGESPNYHLDDGNGDKRTVICTIEDAIQINQFLYKIVHPLVLCKEFDLPEKKAEFFHLAMIEEDLVPIFQDFVNSYNQKEDLIERLSFLHDFVDHSFSNTQSGHKILQTLLRGFNNRRFHLSELKTMLVISKPFKTHALLDAPRAALLETYESKK